MLDAVTQLLDYAATNPDAKITYKVSNMVLYIHLDASYLTALEAKSRAGGYFYLGWKPGKDGVPTPNHIVNAPINILCSVLKNLMASAAEAEVGALYENTHLGVPWHQTLIKLGHPQPPMPVQTDNTTACDIIPDTIKQK